MLSFGLFFFDLCAIYLIVNLRILRNAIIKYIYIDNDLNNYIRRSFIVVVVLLVVVQNNSYLACSVLHCVCN